MMMSSIKAKHICSSEGASFAWMQRTNLTPYSTRRGKENRVKRIIVDFDNTMGVRGRDVDDGLALLYLIGNPELVEVEAACTAYGNATIDIVHENTLRLFKEWHLDIPVYRGATTSGEEDASSCEAARLLARSAREHPGEISLLATGSLTNLKGARMLDADFFRNIAEIALMGGITESLIINGRIMNELNLSCDAQAALAVLEGAAAGNPTTIATAQNCLPAFFTREDLVERFSEDGYLTRAVGYWFSDMEKAYGCSGFICWDVVAAAALVKPELFCAQTRPVTLSERMLSIGLLEQAAPESPQATIATPRIADAKAFKEDVLSSWERALRILGIE